MGNVKKEFDQLPIVIQLIKSQIRKLGQVFFQISAERAEEDVFADVKAVLINLNE